MVVGVPACFIFGDQISKETTGYKLSVACDKSIGPHGGIDGCQFLNGLWRLYPLTEKARQALLTNGITIDRRHIPVIGTNPKIVDGPGESVKLIIGKIPLSLSNSEIEKALAEMDNVKVRSKLFYEHYRDEDGKLTSYKSGRRFVYIDKPISPLPKSIDIVKWKASLYHFGQKKIVAASDSNLDDSAPPPSNQDVNRDSTTEKTVVGLTCENQSASVSPLTMPTSSQVSSESASSPEVARETNQTLDKFFRKPPRPSTQATSRGRQRGRQRRSRSVSTSRKRTPSDDDDFDTRSQSKSRRAEGISTTPDYFDYDPTRE